MDSISIPNSFGRKEVFGAALVQGAAFAGAYELPELSGCDAVPDKLIPFEKAFGSKDYQAWVHFYMHDYKFEQLWRSQSRYLPLFKRFAGVIGPDFSLYREMPLSMQIWNAYRNRALGYWLERNGVRVIPNVRWGDERSYDFCFDGLPANGIIAIGTHGCIKRTEDKRYFADGLQAAVNRLSPHTIIVYGAAPEALFGSYKSAGISIIQFDSLYQASRRQVNA